MNNKENIECDLKPFLLQNVVFMLNNKVIKKGRLQIINTKQFFLKFNLQTPDGIKVFEIPYPYKYNIAGNRCTFEYTLSSMCNSSKSHIFYKLKTLSHKGCNKMYDNTLYMLSLTGVGI
jgi:hypothetical protein